LNQIVNANEAVIAVIDGPRALLISSAKDGRFALDGQRFRPGFDGTKLESIFDAFYSTKPGGTGIAWG
jgi:hypothetical protein